MNQSDDVRVDSLKWYREGRGLTQTDLARLVGVSQQAIAKWENSNTVPKDRLASIAKHLRIPSKALLGMEGASEDEKDERVAAFVGEFFAPQVVVDFGSQSFHYKPTAEEASAFWNDLQAGGFVHLSAGPIQALINSATMLRIDVSEDPPLSSFKPYPISPTDGLKGRDEAEADEADRPWFEDGFARIFLRGVQEPYSAPQAFFEDYIERDALSESERAEIYERFQGARDDEHSIFDLFEHIVFQSDAAPFLYNPGEELHADSMQVFSSEDYDGVPQHTWVHNRDIQIVEVPTRLWELHCLSLEAWSRAAAKERKAKQPATSTSSRKRKKA